MMAAVPGSGEGTSRAATSRNEENNPMTSRFWRLLSVTVAMLLAVAACGGGGATASPSASEVPSATASPATASEAPASPSAAAEPEIFELTVGTLPIVDVAPVHIAIAEGLFEAEGLTVTPEVMQGGAAAIPALQGGDLDIAFGAWPSFLIANQAGISLRAVADGVVGVEGFTQFLAMPDSGLEGNPAGMAGKTVALNTLGNVAELNLRFTLQLAGVDFSDVTPVELPFPEMGAALDGGSVDVIWTVEPGATASKANLSAVVVSEAYIGDMADWPVAGYFVTQEFAEQNPNTVAAFSRALEAAAQLARDDAAVLPTTVQTYTTIPPELTEQLSYPEYRGALDPAQLQRVYDLLLQFEMIDEGLDVNALVIDPT
jgi:ABC-type nitrate/sulfonate/bicarbonate transport system substrate-binding protein